MKPKIAIIGGGASGLFFASEIDTNRFEVSLFEKNNQPGRKLLVAGKGGFNLSHSEPINQLKTRYTPDNFLSTVLLKYDNVELQNWFKQNGIPTFIGSSKRIFPEKQYKPIQVVNTILKVIETNGVHIYTNHEWIGFDHSNELVFKHEGKTLTKSFDYIVYAMGGASWKVTGSDGNWTNHFKSTKLNPFKPSNCAYLVEWPDHFIAHTEGKPLKNISLTCNGITRTGELMITEFGLEGSPIYGLSPQIRNQLNQKGSAIVYIDLKPEFDLDKIIKRLSETNQSNQTKLLQNRLKLSKEKIRLLKAFTDLDTFKSPEKLAGAIKRLPVPITGTAPLDEAISTVGGIALNEISPDFEIKKIPGHFAIGEMLDWDAPTGGYLIQACFSMGLYLANYFNRKD